MGYSAECVVVSSRVIRLLSPGKADEYAKKELEAEHYRKQCRSNLSKIIGFLEDLTLKPAHIDCLWRTHFYNFLRRAKIEETILRWADDKNYFVDQLRKKRRFKNWCTAVMNAISVSLDSGFLHLCTMFESWFCVQDTS